VAKPVLGVQLQVLGGADRVFFSR